MLLYRDEHDRDQVRIYERLRSPFDGRPFERLAFACHVDALDAFQVGLTRQVSEASKDAFPIPVTFTIQLEAPCST